MTARASVHRVREKKDGHCREEQLREGLLHGGDSPAACLQPVDSSVVADGLRAAALLVCLALVACATASAPHIGKTARPENRFPLSELPASETTWSAKDLSLNYLAVNQGGNLAISGFVAFSPNLAKYPNINSFRIYLHFLDGGGTVLDSKLLWVTARRVDKRFVRWTFEKQWSVPPGAVALAFSYRGGVVDGGGESSNSPSSAGWEVYQSP